MPKFEVRKLYNSFSRKLAFVQIPSEADVEILKSVTPAQDTQLFTARVRLVMPTTFQVNGAPQVNPRSIEKGFAVLPSGVDFKQYIDRGLKLRLTITLMPGGQIVQQEHVFDADITKTNFEFEVFR